MTAKSLLLTNVPKDIWETILKKQSEVKLSSISTQFSMASTVYKIIREHERNKSNATHEKD